MKRRKLLSPFIGRFGSEHLARRPVRPGTAARAEPASGLHLRVVWRSWLRPQRGALAGECAFGIEQGPGLSFAVHVGDLSSARYGCTDEMQARRLAQFNAVSHPLIYTPGDNEWTDCHEGQNVKGFDPLERLAKLRTVFFQGEQSLGKRTMPLIRQSQDPDFAKYRENVRWDLGGVTFVTLHVPGSNNGLGRSPDGDTEFAERNKANTAWLRQAFAHAKAADSRAVMVLQQANMFPEMTPFPGKPQTPVASTTCERCWSRKRQGFSDRSSWSTATATISGSTTHSGRTPRRASDRRHRWRTSCVSKPSGRPMITGCMQRSSRTIRTSSPSVPALLRRTWSSAISAAS